VLSNKNKILPMQNGDEVLVVRLRTQQFFAFSGRDVSDSVYLYCTEEVERDQAAIVYTLVRGGMDTADSTEEARKLGSGIARNDREGRASMTT
jgi:hypothetical protein